MSETIKRYDVTSASELFEDANGSLVDYEVLATERAAREAAELLWKQAESRLEGAMQLADAETERADKAEARAARLVEELRWMRAKWEKHPDGVQATLVNANGTEIRDWIDRVDSVLRALVGGEGEK